MSNDSLKHILTQDGSSTLYSPRFDQHYHSLHGAVQESLHVFIEAGLNYLPSSWTEVSVLEMGFGTGLNAFLTLLYAQDRVISYTAVEAYPVSAIEINFLNYENFLDSKKRDEPFTFDSLEQMGKYFPKIQLV